MTETQTTNRRAPIALWRIAYEFLNILYNLFGDSSAIAKRHTITTKVRNVMLPWFRAGEALLRRLLLIEAAHYAKDELNLLSSPARAPRKREREAVLFSPEDSDQWRVSFRCFLDRRRPRRRSSVRRKEPLRFHSAWPLALRSEAMVRVFNDPELYALRLARRLYAQPQRAKPIVEFTPARTVSRDFFEDTRTAAQSAHTHFLRDTS